MMPVMQQLAPDVHDYLEALAERCQLLLLADLVGVYAAGSLALDAYEQGRSDIDIAVVCAAELPRATKEALVAALRHESLPCPARGLELVVYRSDVARAAGSDPGFEVELNTGPRMDFRATYSGDDRRERDGRFWYAIDRSILTDRGAVLVGPPAAQVFRSVSDPDLVDLLIASLRWHLGLELDAQVPTGGLPDLDDAHDDQGASWTDDAVLNACRAWQRVRTGHWFSKIDAGLRVLADRPTQESGPVAGDEVLDHAVVEQALAARSGGPPPSVRLARQFQREVLGALTATAHR
jgi:hypothetical protein